MSVKEVEGRCFRVQADQPYGDQAMIFLREGVGGEGDRQYHWATVSVTGHLGDFGYHWNSMGCPAAEFFAKTSFDYVMTKFMGNTLWRFDLQKTIKDWRERIIDSRKTGEFTKDEARELWDAVSDVEQDSEVETERQFIDHLEGCRVYGDHDLWEVGGSHSYTPQAVQFWEKIWLQWVDHLIQNAPPVYAGSEGGSGHEEPEKEHRQSTDEHRGPVLPRSRLLRWFRNRRSANW